MAQRGGKGGGSTEGSGKARAARGRSAAKGRSGARARSGTQASRSEQRRVPGWVWLLAGAALGAGALYLGLYQQQREGAEPAEQAPEPDQQGSGSDQQGSEESASAADEERSYDFYELLMEEEASVPAEESAAADERRTEDEEQEEISRAATFEAGESYLLQAGSFRHRQDAESMRATLALLGLPVQVHTVELDGGEEWHRVRVGPFEERARLEEARSRMEAKDIQPLMLRQKG
ncbi:MAG: SPOR domain-containing protein [Halorhodospira sp.]